MPNRAVILNDIKLFAQAHSESGISHFVTSDTECGKIYNAVKGNDIVAFDIVDIADSLSSTLGEFPFE